MRWGEPGFSDLLAGGYLGVMTLGWVALVWLSNQWGRAWRLDLKREPEGSPKVSVCIPARDEEGNIGAAVRSVLAEGYPNLELIVLDDGSSDATAEEAAEAAGGDERFRLIRGSDLPRGWAGKPWACQRAGSEASGDYILFVDADVQLNPGVISASVAVAQERDLTLLSLFGDWKLLTFWEKAVIPVVGWLIRGTVDLDAANSAASPEAFANGQYILFRADRWRATGGHELVRNAVLEDVGIAKAFKRRSHACGLYHAPGGFSVRLYRGLGEIISGYRKNLYEGMGRSPTMGITAILFVVFGTLLPAALSPMLLTLRLTGALAVGWGWILWSALFLLLIPAFRWRLERLDGRSGWHALTHPLGNLVLVWIILTSMFSMEVQWKGRTFTDGRAE